MVAWWKKILGRDFSVDASLVACTFPVVEKKRLRNLSERGCCLNPLGTPKPLPVLFPSNLRVSSCEGLRIFAPGAGFPSGMT